MCCWHIGHNQYNRKLNGAEEEVNYCTDFVCTNYLDTCEEKEYYEYNELCYGFPFDVAKKFDCEILMMDNYKRRAILQKQKFAVFRLYPTNSVYLQTM